MGINRIKLQNGAMVDPRMKQTYQQNIAQNRANQAARARELQIARARLPGYVAPQRIAAPTPTPVQEGSLGPIGIPERPGLFPQPPSMPITQPMEPPKKIIQPEERVVKKPIDIVDFYKEVTQPGGPADDMMFTKQPVAPDPNTPIDELVRPIMPTLPVEPRTGQDILEGFAKFKEQNPGAGAGPGLAVMIYGRLPDGTPLTFGNSAQASAFSQYLESIGQPPFEKVFQPISKLDDSKEKSLLAPMGLMGIMPPMASEGGGEFPGGIMIDGKKYFSEQEAIKDMGIERYNQLMADGGRVGLMGGSMPMGEPRVNKGGITELDYRAKGGFVPVGIKEKADDVPAMLSKNEFVFTADAVRGAGNGSIENGAQKMYDTMKNLERRVT